MTALIRKAFNVIEATTDEAGSFVALVSTYTEDRQRETVLPGAFAKTLERWRESGRMIPARADHDGRSLRSLDALTHD